MVNFPGKERYDAQDLRAVVEILRGENGCPWDRVQTHATLRRDLLEECAELCEAIDREDPHMMREELGDVWLQVIFHASIEQELGHFDLDDVADAECRKLISRHPHVFSDTVVKDVDRELELWEELKRSEKRQATAADAMDGVCRTLPGLWRAEKIQKKAAADGEDVKDPGELTRKLSAAAENVGKALGTGGDVTAALGELLFHAVYAARLAGADPEAALHAKCEDYIRTYRREREQSE